MFSLTSFGILLLIKRFKNLKSILTFSKWTKKCPKLDSLKSPY